jgi:phosphopantetheine--protein transferase-like protein
MIAPAMTAALTRPPADVNVGIDVEAIARFEHVADDRMSGAIFAEEEHAARPDDVAAAAHYAGTWCAKEAAVKALWPWMQLDPRRIVVTVGADGRPAIRIVDPGPDLSRLTIRLRIVRHETIAIAWVVAAGADASTTPSL